MVETVCGFVAWLVMNARLVALALFLLMVARSLWLAASENKAVVVEPILTAAATIILWRLT